MMVNSNKNLLQFFTFTIFLILSWKSIKPVRGGEGGKGGKEDEKGYDYQEKSTEGPEHWGELKGEWKECKKGKLQSPIDLLDSKAKKVTSRADDLKMSYKPSNATLRHEGYDISIEWEGDAGSIQINGTDYLLKRCHWHRTAEHAINCKRHDLELHMVHQSQNKKVAVVAFLYQTGNPDPFLSKIKCKVTTSLTDAKEIGLGMIDPSSIRKPSAEFYRYIGSLTAPPCTGGVIWSVNKEVLSVSQEQLGLFERAANGSNARPLQPLNDREVTLFGPQLRSGL